ncbi:MAG: sulfatase-like hydrolase/transferase, partial [Akkermansiaceae bacterium]|nr:sulfatase-like hydrolase/transferase [Akkermansiaceae bacterium]
DLVTLPEVLRDKGYATGLFGKWHLGDDYPYRPQDRGFEQVVYHRGGGLAQISDHWGNDYFDDTLLVNGEPKKFNGYCTDVFFDEAMKFIKTNKDKPFLCFITPNAPHSPYNVEKKYRDLYADDDMPDDRKRFYGMITNIDENFQRLRGCLAELGIEQDTILVFMTDNGTSKGADYDEQMFVTAGFNAGMRGIKASAYEGGHRVPFLLRYPAAGMSVGKDVGSLTGYADFMPSMLDFCGVDSAELELEGKSLRPLLSGDEPDASWLDRVLISDTQRLPHPIKWRFSAVMKADWRLIRGRELYDLASDPGQRKDIAAAHPEVVADLRAEYEEWWQVCSKEFHHSSPVHIGSDECPEVHLTTMELRNDDSNVVWNQAGVRAGQPCFGYWEVLAERAGEYEFVLRRWPEETGYAIGEGITGVDIDQGPEGLISKTALDWYRDGEALDLSTAALQIGERSWQQDFAKDATQVTFKVRLERGPHTVRAWFTGGIDVRAETLLSPHFLSIKRSAEVAE